MKFAHLDGQRQEAQPGLSGECPGCEKPVVAKCGELRVWHWAHKGKRRCDPWWENETEWHRAWKDQFPADWQEIIHFAEDGERHIADLKTGDGCVIEFQHSHLTPDERRARDAFYPKLIWVVDGTRRKRDKVQLLRAWKEGVSINRHPLMRKAFADDCGLLREWSEGRAAVFFDLGEMERLWWLFAKPVDGWASLLPVSRAQFIDWHRDPTTEAARQFQAFGNVIPKISAKQESAPRAQPVGWDPLRPRQLRRHFRF